jgi:extracellular elastinolytic metalloproteinase
MKKIYLLTGLILCFFMQANAQKASLKDAGIDHISKKAKAWNLTETDYEDAIVSSEVYTKHNGVTFLYLNQTYKGTPIYNAISVLSFKDGKIFHSVNGFHSNIEDRIVGAKSASLSPSQALYKVAKQLEIAGPQVQLQKTVGDEMIFDGMNISREDIPVKPMYQMTEEGKLILSYDLSILMMDNPDYWSIRVDANTGEIVGKDNWTVYCQYESVANHSHQNGKCSHAPLKASKFFGASATDNASYDVYALPAESPIHGPFVTVNNPAYPEASPFGWHDTDGMEGPEYTITRGNNVHAYVDDRGQNSTKGDEPDGGADLIFKFEHDMEGEPLESTDAATVNLFYMNNMMHDLMFLFGFDEASGNFQQNNYSGQGSGGDPVLAEALDEAGLQEGARNNANFSVTPDGVNGRMQMYVWENSSDVFKITAPNQLSGIIQVGEVGTAGFGQPINATTDVEGELAIARDGTPDSPTQACQEIVNASEIAGKIAIVDRGLCDFSRKAYNVQQAGAIGCIIVNVPGVNGGTGEEILDPGPGDNATEVIIPTIFIKTSDGNAIKEVLENTPVEGLFKDESTTQELDGAFDNGIVAHEYGHGISTRLTGGPNQAACLTNAEQMGEGWSDFFSLITTVEPGDQGSDARGIGTFALGQDTESIGIRQFPYSTDMSINPHTYGDVATQGNSVHGIGSVWCAMIWDLYWAMVDEYGYSDDWRDTESGNFKAIQLVMDGMRFQGCNPEFVQGRQGILQADLVNYDGENEELIWRVFARRGLGYYADSGSTESSTDGVEDFNIPPLFIEELKINRSSLERAKPGEILAVTLDIVNHIPSTQENVIVTDEIQEGLSYVQGSASIEPIINGNALTFDIGTMAYEEERSITYEVRLDESSRSESILLDDFEDDLGWEEEDWKEADFHGLTTI